MLAMVMCLDKCAIISVKSFTSSNNQKLELQVITTITTAIIKKNMYIFNELIFTCEYIKHRQI